VFFPGTPKAVVKWSRSETNTWRQQPGCLGSLVWSHNLAGSVSGWPSSADQSSLICWKQREVPSPTRVFSRSSCESLYQLGAQVATGLMADQCNTVSVGKSCSPTASVSSHWH